jgi:hypothetical protein
MPSPEPTERAAGPFDVRLTPEAGGVAAEAGLGRMAIDKTYHGDLEGTGRGEMLASRGAVDGSAGYVALERVSGTLKGRRGTFVLQHSGTMTRGTPGLVITVVPDSGTDELTGLAGSMNIVITGKAHAYEFDYLLPASSTP